MVVIGGEEFVKILVDPVASALVLVVNAVVGEQVFEVSGLRCIVFVAAERDEDEPAGGFEDAAELGEGTRDVEPVEGAAGGDDGDGCIGETCGFSGAVADFESDRKSVV